NTFSPKASVAAPTVRKLRRVISMFSSRWLETLYRKIESLANLLSFPRRGFAEEAFVLLAHFAAADLDRSVVLDPAAYQAKAGIRRAVVHALSFPALAREGGQNGVRVAGIGGHVSMVRPGFGQRQIAQLQLVAPDRAARRCGPHFDGAAVGVTRVHEQRVVRMRHRHYARSEQPGEQAGNAFRVVGWNGEMMNSHGWVSFLWLTWCKLTSRFTPCQPEKMTLDIVCSRPPASCF